MRSMLLLYMTKVLLFTDSHSYGIYAIFSAFLYLAAIPGGLVADKLIGSKKAVVLGAVFLISGYAALSLNGKEALYLGLSSVIVGSGLFMPNLASMLGGIYGKNDAKQESTFSLFYTFINIGSFFPPLVCVGMIYYFGWHAAFFIASIGVTFALILFITFFRDSLLGTHPKIKHPTFIFLTLVLLCVLTVYALSSLVTHTALANILIFTIGAIFVAYTFSLCFKQKTIEKNKLLVCFILIFFSIIFSVLYQQAGMSLVIFTEFNVNRHFLGYLLPTILVQSLNPFFIIVFGPILAWFWDYLGSRSLNPSIPTKFGIGTVLMGLGFILLTIAIYFSPNDGRISSLWIIMSYFMQTIAELFVSPIGLSMVIELSPYNISGLMMGAWYFATAIADALAGVVSKLTTLSSGSNNPILTNHTYSHVFHYVGLYAVLAGLLLLSTAKKLVQFMHSEP